MTFDTHEGEPTAGYCLVSTPRATRLDQVGLIYCEQTCRYPSFAEYAERRPVSRRLPRWPLRGSDEHQIARVVGTQICRPGFGSGESAAT
jgi:hypothetical protein